ncbi:hypothetical protein EYF80_047092 [Liparis tanakae]|uniref:Uncharacterized protein n=1 Tax=Liparis tanakae TaxID=230148 RepID=A0A4Z2FQV0_9TELE|nr:hypothetical protein EYF80_047092 [Liparis tanakae]
MWRNWGGGVRSSRSYLLKMRCLSKQPPSTPPYFGYMTLRVWRDVKLTGAWRLCLGSGHWCGVKRENGGHVATGFLQRACCSLRYSVMMLSNAGGDGRCRSNCFFMAGLWLKAPWSDFCRSTRGFLQLAAAAAHAASRSREKTMRPMSGEPLVADVEGKAAAAEVLEAAAAAAGCDDVEGRDCGLPEDPGLEARAASRDATPFASRGVRGSVATGDEAIGGGGATVGNDGAAATRDGHAIGSSASLVRALAVSWRPLATRWLRMSSSSSFSGKEMRDLATTLARCSHARDTSVPISSGLPEMRSMSSAANLQNLTCSLRLSCSTGSFISCWMWPLLNSGSLLMICRTEVERDRPTRALQARARIWSASVIGIFTAAAGGAGDELANAGHAFVRRADAVDDDLQSRLLDDNTVPCGDTRNNGCRPKNTAYARLLKHKRHVPTVETEDPPSSSTATASDNSSWVFGTTSQAMEMSCRRSWTHDSLWKTSAGSQYRRSGPYSIRNSIISTTCSRL